MYHILEVEWDTSCSVHNTDEKIVHEIKDLQQALKKYSELEGSSRTETKLSGKEIMFYYLLKHNDTVMLSSHGIAMQNPIREERYWFAAEEI